MPDRSVTFWGSSFGRPLMSSSSRLSQPEKQLLPSFVRLSGRLTEVRPVQSKNA